MFEKSKDRNSDSYLKSLPRQKKLSPEQVEDLMWATVYGRLGNGAERNKLLGDWYDVTQRMVNMQMEHIKKQNYVMDKCFVLGKIGEYGAFQQIADEASELERAARKYLRFIKGEDTVYIDGRKADKNSDVDARCLIDKIDEELSDVVLVCDIAGFKPRESIMRGKLSMWRVRLEENSNGKDKEAGHSQTSV